MTLSARTTAQVCLVPSGPAGSPTKTTKWPSHAARFITFNATAPEPRSRLGFQTAKVSLFPVKRTPQCSQISFVKPVRFGLS
jgi:hypothetical protein